MARRALLILLLVYAISYMDRQLVAILVEPIKQEFGMTDAAAGLLYGLAFALFYSFLGIPIARLADRSNRSRIITVSLLLFSTMTALCGVASTYWQLMLARIGVGIGEAGTNPPSHSLIADWYPLERRGTAMAVFAMGLHLGIVLGFLVGGFIGHALGWRATFLCAGITGVLLAGLAVRFLKEPARTHTGNPADQPVPGARPMSVIQAATVLARSTSVRHLFLGAILANIATTALLAWLAAHIMRSHGVSLSATGVLMALVIGVLGAGGTLLGGTLADRLGARHPAWRLRVVVVVFLMLAPCWTIALLTQESIGAFCAFALAGSLIGFHVGPTFAMVQALAPVDTRALAASLLLFLTNLLGVGIGPVLVGVLSDAWREEYGVHSLRSALLVIPPLFLWAAAHYEAAARALATDLSVPTAVSESPLTPTLEPLSARAVPKY